MLDAASDVWQALSECVCGAGAAGTGHSRVAPTQPRTAVLPSRPRHAWVSRENSRECPNPTALPSEEELNFFMGR